MSFGGAYTHMTLLHMASGKEVTIPVKVTNFTQDAKANFSSTEVYGRMDPIFTYQNTSRTFQVTLATPLRSELGLCAHSYGTAEEGKHPVAVLNKSISDFVAKGQAGEATKEYVKYNTKALSTIYQFMYPVYTLKSEGGVSFNQLTAPPLLKILIPKVLSSIDEIGKGFVFVPETFNINTGLANATKNQFVVSGPSDLQYMAPAGGFGFTLGGTILHTDKPPGFMYDPDKDEINFSKGSFPFGAEPAYNPNKILGED